MLVAPDPRPLIARAVRAERRLALGEAWVQALARPLAVLALVVGVVASGVTASVPPLVTSLLALAFWIGLGAWLWRDGRRVRPEPDGALKARIESRAGLGGTGTFEAIDDRPAGADPRALALWAVHQSRAAQALAGTKPTTAWRESLMKPSVAVLGLAVLALMASLVLAPGRVVSTLTVHLSALAGDRPLVVDAWATPPEAFGGALIRLPPEGGAVVVPKGSVITVRVDGPRGGPVLRGFGEAERLARTPEGAWAGTIVADRAGSLGLDRLGRQVTWRVAMLPDAVPGVTLTPPVAFDPAGRIRLTWKATDDHGIAAVLVRMRPVDPPEGLRGAEPWDVAVPLTDARDRALEATTPLDLRPHPLAGLEVDLTLVAVDTAGQESASAPQRVMLPEQSFKSLPARAVIEQRRALVREARPYRRPFTRFELMFQPRPEGFFWVENRLARAPEGVHRTLDLMDAFLLANPVPENAILLGLAAARAQLVAASSIGQAQAAAPLLWDIAQRLERGNQTEAEQELNAARDALEQALRDGAGEQELREAMDRLRAAIDARIQELAQNGEAGPPPEGAEDLSAQDLDALLDALEESGQTGARGEALVLLDQLDQLLQNLTVSPGGQGGGPGQGSGQGQAEGEGPLDELARQQQDLADQTLREQQAQRDGAAAGSGEGAEPGDGLEGLAEQQRQLRDQLGQSGDESEAGRAAGEAMAEAEQALREGDAQRALEAQDRALGSLRAAAENARGADRGGTDPLGRRIGNGGQDSGQGTRVPDTPERRRSREVLDEVRKRAADPQRPPEERNYLERLLDRFSGADRSD